MGKSAGKIMPLPRGAYDENATYNILDMVTLDNKLWIATRSGITGITPSKTATEWMMAVDGTTDVKALETEVDAKFASIDEQFLAKDTQISGLNTRVTAAEGSISSLGGRCDEIDGKFVFDAKPTEGSNNLITSGAAFSLTRKKYSQGSGENGYENFDNYLLPSSQGIILKNDSEQYSDNGNGKILHRHMTAYAHANYGTMTIGCRYTLENDHTDPLYYEESSAVNCSGGIVSMDLRKENESTTYFRFYRTRMETQDTGTYDIGSSYNKFKDIYATNGTIQTSDVTEKKDITDLNPELVSDLVMALRPVSFKFIDGTSDRTHYGLVAQEVEETVNNLGISNQDFAPLIKTQKVETDENGNETPIDGEYVYGLRYSEFTAILIKMCQNLQNEVDELKTRLGGE